MHANHVTTQMTNDFLCSFLQQGKQRASLKDTSDDVIVYSDCVYTFCNSQKNFAHPPNPAYLNFLVCWGGGCSGGLVWGTLTFHDGAL